MWRGWPFIRAVKLQLVRFVRLRGAPDDIAKGVALGIFIGMTPTLGFQMLIAVFMAMLLQENKLAAGLGVWITNPVTAPFIYLAEYEVGRVLLQMERIQFAGNLTTESVAALSWGLMGPLLLGSIVFGILSAPLAYALTLRLIPLAREIKITRWPKIRPRLKTGSDSE